MPPPAADQAAVSRPPGCEQRPHVITSLAWKPKYFCCHRRQVPPPLSTAHRIWHAACRSHPLRNGALLLPSIPGSNSKHSGRTQPEHQGPNLKRPPLPPAHAHPLPTCRLISRARQPLKTWLLSGHPPQAPRQPPAVRRRPASGMALRQSRWACATANGTTALIACRHHHSPRLGLPNFAFLPRPNRQGAITHWVYVEQRQHLCRT